MFQLFELDFLCHGCANKTVSMFYTWYSYPKFSFQIQFTIIITMYEQTYLLRKTNGVGSTETQTRIPENHHDEFDKDVDSTHIQMESENVNTQ